MLYATAAVAAGPCASVRCGPEDQLFAPSGLANEWVSVLVACLAGAVLLLVLC